MSVYELVKELCIELIKESDTKEYDLASAKRIAFEVLLKQSEIREKDENSALQKFIDESQFCVFELLLLNRSEDAHKVEKFSKTVEERKDILLPISLLLMNLKNIDSNVSARNQVRK